MNMKTASVRYLLTAIVVLVAVLAVLWKYWAYVTNPWTRAARCVPTPIW